ncbi:hypothetical protein BC792_107109 [Sphingobacterium allocomposti]|uniref:Uncharacterized protein n=1 Tax=Sphingobacterium allocomposti TaxID=415956 RepID=A0A5S5DJT1_9SPHI|nr:hypothetical protein [Sphingobacterium composti Yoo et al. 2007 non Ten et al. 2007]TYP96210.1 hypothetical protein BC792_107109 [Sphingobacterium composti Yoo et al. 2007 non Ten et al. 2007]
MSSPPGYLSFDKLRIGSSNRCQAEPIEALLSFDNVRMTRRPLAITSGGTHPAARNTPVEEMSG